MWRHLLPLMLLLVSGLAVCLLPGEGTAGPTTGVRPKDQVKAETATFAAGCFWGVEATFRRVPGVLSTEVGYYTGGTSVNPTYREVCTHTTGHAEAVRVLYDPGRVSYQTLLNIFFESHNPTTFDLAGSDVASQYRSAIFYHSPEQQRLAEAEKERRQQSGEYAGAISTRIVAAGPFYRAEEYHQQYYQKQGGVHFCPRENGKKSPTGR